MLAINMAIPNPMVTRSCSVYMSAVQLLHVPVCA